MTCGDWKWQQQLAVSSRPDRSSNRGFKRKKIVFSQVPRLARLCPLPIAKPVGGQNCSKYAEPHLQNITLP
jgi:hypothetical protein